jgi:hypothetical protein
MWKKPSAGTRRLQVSFITCDQVTAPAGLADAQVAGLPRQAGGTSLLPVRQRNGWITDSG